MYKSLIIHIYKKLESIDEFINYLETQNDLHLKALNAIEKLLKDLNHEKKIDNTKN